MIPNITSGGSFAGALRYDLDKEKGYLLNTNCASTDADGIALEMDVVAAASRSKHPVHHVSLRCPPSETLNDSQWKEVSEKYLEKMGYSDKHQFAAARHTDKDHGDHIHITINRIGSDSKLHNSFQEKRRSQQACREIEKEMGLQRLEDHQELNAGRMKQIRFDLHESIREAKEKGGSHEALSNSLKSKGYELKLHVQNTGRVQGASIQSLEDKKTWKMSEIIRGGLRQVDLELSNKANSQTKIEENKQSKGLTQTLNNSSAGTINRPANLSGSISSGSIESATKEEAEYLIYLKQQQDSKSQKLKSGKERELER